MCSVVYEVVSIHMCVSIGAEGDVCVGLCMSMWVVCVTVREGAGECEHTCDSMW